MYDTLCDLHLHSGPSATNCCIFAAAAFDGADPDELIVRQPLKSFLNNFLAAQQQTATTTSNGGSDQAVHQQQDAAAAQVPADNTQQTVSVAH